jgi:hypothetical protein
MIRVGGGVSTSQKSEIAKIGPAKHASGKRRPSSDFAQSLLLTCALRRILSYQKKIPQANIAPMPTKRKLSEHVYKKKEKNGYLLGRKARAETPGIMPYTPPAVSI